MKKQNGFTLIELMIVIAVIGILSAITVPNISAYNEKNKEKHRIEHKNTIDKAIRQCYAIEGKLPQSIEYIEQNKYAFIDKEKYEYKYTPNNYNHTYDIEIDFKD